jgi:hypothetical protein
MTVLAAEERTNKQKKVLERAQEHLRDHCPSLATCSCARSPSISGYTQYPDIDFWIQPDPAANGNLEAMLKYTILGMA